MAMNPPEGRHRTRQGGRRACVALLSVLACACTDITVPDYNNPGLEAVESNPTPSAIRNLATGLLIGARLDQTTRTSYVAQLGIIGREAYILDGSDPRFVSELLIGPLTNSGAYGGGLWGTRYQSIRNSNILLNALETVSDDPIAGIPAQQKEAIRGFAKTIQALELLLVINTRDVNGAPIDVNTEVSAPPAALANKAQVFARINQLLEEGRVHLAAGGATFSFPLSPVFAECNTPAKFLRFNRAIKARVSVYQKNYAQALTELAASFLDPSAPLTLGAYHTYGSGSGETINELTNPNIYAHPSIVSDAELRPNGTPDLRLSKVRKVEAKTVSGLTSDLGFTMYTSATSPVPVIRNEELILLRAEARWFTGDKVGALEDINLIRVQSGGLAPLTAMPASDADFVTELLKQRRYSLLFEGGHRWIDARRFGRLEQLPKDAAGHTVHSAYGIPEAECLARNLSSTCKAS